MTQKTLISIQHLQKYYPVKKANVFQRHQEYVKANKDISLDIKEGETLGIVGESGCGKSTLGRTIIQLQDQTGGSTMYYGDTIENLMPDYVRKVYQDLAKTSQTYDVDFAQLENLKADTTLVGIDTYRLSKIAFDEKYGNTLRLGGGLLVHDDLSVITKILLKRYESGSDLASLNRDIDFEEERFEMSQGKNKDAQSRAASLRTKRDAVQNNFEAIEKELSAVKDSLRDHPKFDYYEQFRDRGIDLASLTKKEMNKLRNDLQIIFQDPYSSLNPRMTVGDIIGEGLLNHGLFESRKSPGYKEYIEGVMEQCGLSKEFISRYPHQFSGGQRQRIGIARAIALNPKFIVCDEAVSALDVSIQSQVINLLQTLKREQNLTYLFITHDLGVVRYISDRIGVMYFGNLVELASAQDIFNNPQHPYTKQLLAAIPSLNDDGFKARLKEENDDPRFEFQFKTTGEADKDWFEVSEGHFVACYLKERGDL